MKLINAVAISTLFITTHLAADVDKFQRKGYIQNDNGDKCWYTQQVDSQSKYFHGTLTGYAGIIKFDDANCMSDHGIGLDTNKMMINNLISRWYSHSDAKFKTRASELYKGSALQKKGQCMQSGTYATIGITVDYIVENDSIVEVRHGASVQGCTN